MTGNFRCKIQAVSPKRNSEYVTMYIVNLKCQRVNLREIIAQVARCFFAYFCGGHKKNWG